MHSHSVFSDGDGKVEDVIEKVETTLGDLLQVSESYHMAYSPDLINKSGAEIKRISDFCESKGLLPVGGRDSHRKTFLNI